LTPGSTPQTSEITFTDEKFEVIPVHAKTGSPSSEEPGTEAKNIGAGPPGPTAPSPDFTEDDLMFLSESVWNLPGIFLDKLPPRDPEKLKKWNAQFYRYCVKKGINPWEWFFDELPLALASIGMVGGIWRDYKEQYRNNNNGKEQSKQDEKLSSDFEHAKQVAEKKEQDIKDGVISTAAQAAVPGATG